MAPILVGPVYVLTPWQNTSSLAEVWEFPAFSVFYIAV